MENEKGFKNFLRTLPVNVAKCFWGYNLLFQLLAMGLTYVLVTTGFDWFYFTATRNTTLLSWAFPAAIAGGLVPIFGPIVLLIVGKIKKNFKITNTAWALGQAAIIGLAISSFYKAFTGRIPPELFTNTGVADISRGFRFGFLRGGVFWGWPSSHTIIVFAMALTLWILFPKNKKIIFFALLYAIYIGLGVSATIHWFSDFAAGVIFGIIIGLVVGKAFKNDLVANES